MSVKGTLPKRITKICPQEEGKERKVINLLLNRNKGIMQKFKGR